MLVRQLGADWTLFMMYSQYLRSLFTLFLRPTSRQAARPPHTHHAGERGCVQVSVSVRASAGVGVGMGVGVSDSVIVSVKVVDERVRVGLRVRVGMTSSCHSSAACRATARRAAAQPRVALPPVASRRSRLCRLRPALPHRGPRRRCPSS